MKCLFFLTVLVSLTAPLQAQPPPTSFNKPLDFRTYLNLGAGTTGAELGISTYPYRQIATDLFGKILYEDGIFTDFPGDFIAGLKVKLYRTASASSLYIGPLVGVHNFSRRLRPIFGITTGIDHFGEYYILFSNPNLRLGIELQGGIDIVGDGYVGINASIGLGGFNDTENSRR